MPLVVKRTPEGKLCEKLKKKNLTISFAESCTGGLVSSKITDISGSSACFVGGVVAYSDDIKENILSVPVELLKEHGAVSSEVALAMAKGIKRLMNTNVAASITGILGPLGGRKGKPVGTAFISVIAENKEEVRKIFFSGGRKQVKKMFSESLIGLVIKMVNDL